MGLEGMRSVEQRGIGGKSQIWLDMSGKQMSIGKLFPFISSAMVKRVPGFFSDLCEQEIEVWVTSSSQREA
jgi:hypothetical protein